MNFKNNRLRYYRLSIILLLFIGLSTLNNSNTTNFGDIQDTKTNTLLFANPIDYLQDYNGTGNDIQILINGTGYGNSSSTPSLKDGWINLYPPPSNQSTFSITTPTAQRFQNVFLNATQIEKAQFHEIILNDTSSSDFLKLNNYVTLNQSRAPNQAALKVLFESDTYITRFSVFARWNMPSIVSVNITNALGTGITHGLAYYNISGIEAGRWIDFIFTDVVNLSTGAYWFVINVAPSIDVLNDTYHFSLNFVNDTFGQNQESKYFNRSLGQWQDFGFNFLAKYTNYSWTPSTLTEIALNATIPLANSTQNFSGATNTTSFTQPIESAVPLNSILINFQSNATVRFKLNYSIDVSTNTTFFPTSFIYSNGSQYVRWYGNYTLQKLQDGLNRTQFPTQNYTILGFHSFISMNATNGSLIIDVAGNILIINNSIGEFSSEWQFNGYSVPVNCTIANADGTSKIQRGFNLIIKANYTTNQYKTNMSIWGNETFLNSSYKQRTATNQSDSVEFDPIMISGTAPYEKLLIRVDWNNGTEAGITYRIFYLEDGSQISSSASEIQIISDFNGTFIINYSNYQNVLISDATIETNWSSANWSYTFVPGSGYRFSITTDSIPLGASGFIQINVSHYVYRNQTITLKVYHVIPTNLTVNDLDTMIYLNNTFYADLAYYSAKGLPTSLHDATITLIVDGKICGFAVTRINQTNPNTNLQIRVNSGHANFPNSSGNFTYSIQLTMRVGDTIYENKTIGGILEIKRIPSQFTFVSTTAYELNIITKEMIEYEKYNNSMILSVKFIANKTLVRGLGEKEPNPNVPIWIEITESNLKRTFQMQYQSNGIYRYSISTFNISAGSTLGIRMFVNHTFYEPNELIYSLRIIEKMKPVISLDNIQNIREGTIINITGSVLLDNKSVMIPLKSTNISIEIIFSGEKGNQSMKYVILTDLDGKFALHNISVPFQREFQRITVVITVNETREYIGLSQRSSAAIIEYLFGYITSRVVIGFLIVLFVGIISAKYIYPSIKYVVTEKKLLKKIERTALSQFLSGNEKEGYYLRVAKPQVEDPLLLAEQPSQPDPQLEILKVHNVPEDQKDSRKLLRNIAIGLLETLGSRQEKDPAKIKELALQSAAKLKSRGKFKEAIQAFNIALKNAKILNLADETAVIEAYIKECEQLMKK